MSGTQPLSGDPEFTPSGVVTLTTDFGHKGPFIGTMKGQVLRRLASATVIDLSHECSVHWPAEAGFWVSRAYPYFPRGTVHAAVVDPGVGTSRDIVLVLRDGHAFLAPDNGLLEPLCRGKSWTAFKVSAKCLEDVGIDHVSATFHGRDIFAPLAAELASGRLAPQSVGEQIAELVPSILEEPEQHGGKIHGVVVTVDNFGNLISNIDESMLSDFRTPVVQAGGHQFTLLRTYGQVAPGDYLALVNSFGVVEIARAEKSAADGLGLERGAPVLVSEAV
jgi:S-adenosylmethionine hydrolase